MKMMEMLEIMMMIIIIIIIIKGQVQRNTCIQYIGHCFWNQKQWPMYCIHVFIAKANSQHQSLGGHL